ncbi:hypothetical protein KAZ93_03685 [Patescibacteria group bacterium]|nr:hypothetical protein [Patescibacteria group bacterium]
MEVPLMMQYPLCTESDIEHRDTKPCDTSIEASSVVSSSYHRYIDHESLGDDSYSFFDCPTSSIEREGDPVDTSEEMENSSSLCKFATIGEFLSEENDCYITTIDPEDDSKDDSTDEETFIQ